MSARGRPFAPGFILVTYEEVKQGKVYKQRMKSAKALLKRAENKEKEKDDKTVQD